MLNMKRKYLIPIGLALLAILSLVLAFTVSNSDYAGAFGMFILSFVTYFAYLKGLEPMDRVTFFYTNRVKYLFQLHGKLHLYKALMKWVCIISAILGAVMLMLHVPKVIFS